MTADSEELSCTQNFYTHQWLPKHNIYTIIIIVGPFYQAIYTVVISGIIRVCSGKVTLHGMWTSTDCLYFILSMCK